MKMIIKIDEEGAVKISMKCINPECGERFREKVYNFSYGQRDYGQEIENVSAKNIIVNEKKLRTQIVCDKCGQLYHVEILKSE